MYNDDRNTNLRYNLITILVYIVGIVLIVQLFNLQIVNGKEYRETSNTRLSRETVIKAARGSIKDRTGNLLVTTKMGFNIELYKTKINTTTLNKTILNTIKILENNNDKYINNLPISIEPFKFTIDDEESQVNWKKENDIKEDATPEQCFYELKEKYKIEQDNILEVYKIMVVRYEISRNGYSSIRPVTIAKDVSRESAVKLGEQSIYFPGISATNEPMVSYPSGSLASHILGYVGNITETELDGREDTYGINDVIGKVGIQYVFEEYLRGKDGIKQLDMSVDGTITDEYITQEAVAGSDVILTIDANLQAATEKALANNIKKIASGGFSKRSDAKAGAAVVMNVKTGEILAMASYPDYEPELFVNGISQKKLDEYNKGDNIFNRAISGVYAPGSTFKMITAIAGLETGVITPTEKINDIGVYKKAHEPACWIWNSYGMSHGWLNVTEAITHSCNYFFYEVGYRATIDNIAKYAKYYGLGEKTNVELPMEEKGIVATRDKAKERGDEWQIGETLSAAIGQSYNSYTPIQMAKYISMLANGGEPIDVTIVKSINDVNGNQVSKEDITKFVNAKLGLIKEKKENLNIKKENIDAILKGMKGVTSEEGGTAYSTFANFNIELGGKTGSAQTDVQGKINGWFVGFAPYEEPEIAVVVLVENAGSGSYTAEVARDILQEYFGMNMEKVEEDLTAMPSTEIQN
ncbi:MAG TPA: penicillin-binding transpeptidase domain-containing protein [Clostridiaceae bacterium]|nr:penicillin-binding transpeptidase domain-containing protein [Clostridiaceae bacterium]